MRGPNFICRDCAHFGEAKTSPARCPECGSPRMLFHSELSQLSIAHVDCDAFFASVEKRDNPELRDKPVIVGGGKRGVVSTCCYIARQSGIHSAMPAVTAKRLCPDAVFVKPQMSKYVAVSKHIRELMDALTPVVEPLSIDEAFLDMTGTQLAHKIFPAAALVKFARAVRTEIGVTISVGLSHNKFLAKVASDLDKPRGFSIIGVQETMSFLAPKPISIIYGAGKVFTQKLAKDGFLTIGQLQNESPELLMRRYGAMGARLARLSRGEDPRAIKRDPAARSVSTETTLSTDVTDFKKLGTRLLAVSEDLSGRLKKKGLVGDTLTLKLKTAGFRSRTRARHLVVPTQLAHTIFEHANDLLARETDGTAFRLIGVGMSGLSSASGEDPVDLLEPAIARKAAAERAVDKVREKFGRNAVIRGRLYRNPPAKSDTSQSEIKRTRNDP